MDGILVDNLRPRKDILDGLNEVTEQPSPPDPVDYESFFVAVDIVVLTVQPVASEYRRTDFRSNLAQPSTPALHVGLVQRAVEPFVGNWALPGGFVRRGENVDVAAARELAEETGLRRDGDWYLEQLQSYGALERDPRRRVLSIAYFAVADEVPLLRGGSDAGWAEMMPVDRIDRRALAFDHANIIDDALERVRSLLEYTTFGSRFLAPSFSVTELQEVYEAVWDVRLDSGNFRRNLEKCQGFVRVDADGRREHPPRLRQRGRPRSLWSTREPHRRDRAGTLLARALASRDRGTSMLGIRTRPAEPRLDFDYRMVASDAYEVTQKDADSALGYVRKVRDADVDRWFVVNLAGEDLPGSFDTRVDAAYHLWSLAQK